jgi:hypothetical protein
MPDYGKSTQTVINVTGKTFEQLRADYGGRKPQYNLENLGRLREHLAALLGEGRAGVVVKEFAADIGVII